MYYQSGNKAENSNGTAIINNPTIREQSNLVTFNQRYSQNDL
jgi:hypothetical protein